MTAQFKLIAVGVLLLALLFGAYMFGVKTTEPIKENIAPAAAQSLPTGGVVLARVPIVKAPKAKKPGTKVKRAVTVTVQPDQPDCKPVAVDLQLVQDGDGRRVVADSPNGKVTGGQDSPIEAAVNEASHPWAAGVSYGSDRTFGIIVQRDLGRIRVGADVIRETTGTVKVRAHAMWSW